jgi:23S rRNA pseudouridine1911/1915/1917 synthase
LLNLNSKKKGEWLELTIPHQWDSHSIESILREIWKVPRKLLHQLRMEKGVKINGDAYPWSKQLQSGQLLRVHLFPKEAYDVVPNFIHIDILYEDDHLLIVNKPAGMDTHPSDKGETNTLANAVAYHLQIHGIETKIRHIHRLDKDTTGAVLFAKHALAGAIMDRLLEDRIIRRTYVALVHGNLKNKKGAIAEPIGRDRHHPTRRRVSPSGQEAFTSYEVLKYDSKSDTSLVKIDLKTGRTHQIRVHMSYKGHPLVGDKLYSGKENRAPRQALHAARITLPHPITFESIDCVAPFLDHPPIFEGDSNEI